MLKYKVYIKTDESGNITAVNSSIFLTDTTGWTEIDEGEGDKYAHAQNHYFDTPLFDECRNPTRRYDFAKKEIFTNPAHEPPEQLKPINEVEQLRADVDYIAIMTGVELDV